MNREQLTRLAKLSTWLQRHDRRLLFELLVPAEPAQLEMVGGDRDRYDLEILPELIVGAIAELQAASVEPEIWKVEGLDRREDYRGVAEQARSAGRDRVACIILGRGVQRRQARALVAAGGRGAGLHRLCHRTHDLAASAEELARAESGSRRRQSRDRRQVPSDDRRLRGGPRPGRLGVKSDQTITEAQRLHRAGRIR